MIGLDAWFGGGQRVQLALPEQPVHLFCRVVGAGPWVTFLHGFPTCSWDWAAVAEGLAGEHQLLLPDLLGFGNSDKPAGHDYSLIEQADLVEALWRQFHIEETGLVAHDIGGSVAQELLARQSESRLGARLMNVVFLNSALYHHASRPRLAQRLLARRGIGPLVARLMTEQLFSRNLAAAFSPAHPLPAEAAHQYWTALRRHSISPHIHKLLRYIPERTRHHARWENALEQSSVPLHFIWGMQDPVSGAAVANLIRQRLPQARLLALEDVGHYPQIEVPERVLSELRTSL